MRYAWSELVEAVNQCEKCRLCSERTHVVLGEGDPKARLMFIGEGPGREEDRLGRPFVGASGELLTQMIHAIGLERTQTYICNVVKCRPPRNRNPEADEAAACMPYLRAQFALVRPKVIVLLGKVAYRFVIGQEDSIMRVRGQWIERKGVWFMPTLHPAALLRDPSLKRLAWEDFQRVREKLRTCEEEARADAE